MKIVLAGIVVAACLFLEASKGSASLLDENCGTTKRPWRVRRVVGGVSADRFANPWMVMVFSKNRFMCGGSLITSRTYFHKIFLFKLVYLKTRLMLLGFVLTAANCLSEFRLFPIR